MKFQESKISIIVPIYNTEAYLRECLDSLLNQTFTPIQIILVDDGSIDTSPQICDEYALNDSRIKVIHQPNMGVSKARNSGILAADSEWITFVDSDDFVSPYFIEQLYAEVDKHPDIDMLQAGCQRYDDGIITVEQEYAYQIGTDPIYLFNNIRGLTVSKLFRNSIIKTNRVFFDAAMRVSEDQALTFDYVLHVKKYVFIPETGYYYRQRPGSLSHNVTYRSYSGTLIQEFKHLYRSVYRYIDAYGMSEEHSIFRRQQNAERLYYTISHLYLNRISRKERLLSLSEDFTHNEIQVLKYLSGGLMTVIVKLYMNGRLRLFDFTMHLLYTFKLTINRVL